MPDAEATAPAVGATATPRIPIADELRRVWTYRELAWGLAWAQLRVGRRGALLGPLWSIINPLVLILIYFLAFRYVLGYRPVENYPLFLTVGVLHWNMFHGFFTGACPVVRTESKILDRAAFPRLVLPWSHGLTLLGEQVFALLALAFVFPFLGGSVWWGTALYVPVLALALLFGMGATLTLSAWSVFFPDLQEITAILFRLAFFVSPVAFRFDRLSPHWQAVLAWNPFTPFLTAFRAVLYSHQLPGTSTWLAMLGWASLSLALGLLVFRGREPHFGRWLA